MNRVTTISADGLALLEHFEGCELKAYKCPAGVWTIGYGTTRYPDGRKVQPGDKLASRMDAWKLKAADLRNIEKQVDDLTRDDISQHQFDALVSFVYNLGDGALRGSTLLKLVNDPATDSERITTEFLKWDNLHINGKFVKDYPGLNRRRRSEANLYNTGTLKFFETSKK